MTDDLTQLHPENASARFGEVLSRFVPLSRHDIYDVLEEQAVSRKRFGLIAMQMGICESTHLWQAWAEQLRGRTPQLDLLRYGIDSQAAAELDPWAALTLGAVAIRTTDDRLIVATTTDALPSAAQQLPSYTTKQLQFVVADKQLVQEAINRYYGPRCLGEVTATLRRPPLLIAAAPCTGGEPAPCRCGARCKSGRHAGRACEGACGGSSGHSRCKLATLTARASAFADQAS